MIVSHINESQGGGCVDVAVDMLDRLDDEMVPRNHLVLDRWVVDEGRAVLVVDDELALSRRRSGPSRT
jgi:hypothetical protein